MPRPPLPERLPIETRGPLDGEVRVPGSKSITNRALLLAALADGESRLTGGLESDGRTPNEKVREKQQAYIREVTRDRACRAFLQELRDAHRRGRHLLRLAEVRGAHHRRRRPGLPRSALPAWPA